jgi:threonine dehydrogenase-like Zn-dependent dehydrogenase
LDVGESGHLLRQALIDGEEVAIVGFGPIGLAAFLTAQLYSPAAIIPAWRIGLAPDCDRSAVSAINCGVISC